MKTYGLLLENVVFLELKRRGYQMFYFKGKGECDLIAKSADGRLEPYQVAFEVNEKNRDRELEGLVDGCKRTGARHGHIITNKQDEVFKKDGITIDLISITRWLLGASPNTFRQ